MVVRAAKKFWHQFQPVQGDDCKASWQQLQEVAWLGARYKFIPREYFLYGFYKKNVSIADMLTYMSNHAVNALYRPGLNNSRWVPILGNKWLFHNYYSKFNVPITNVFGYFHSRAGLTATGSPLTTKNELKVLLEQKKPSTLVVKPVGGVVSKGVLVFKEIDYSSNELSFTNIDGTIYSFDDVLDHISVEQPGLVYQGYLLEEKLGQHPFMDEINPHTLNTFRVVVFTDTNGQVCTHRTIMRLGRKGNITDSWNKGGVCVAIDHNTGKIGLGKLKPQHGGQVVTKHPDTGVTFTGKVIPMWDQVIEACENAAKVSPHLNSIGWDVILTPNGPVIIEGNHNWDMIMMQVHGSYLTPDIRQQLASYGLTFPK